MHKSSFTYNILKLDRDIFIETLFTYTLLHIAEYYYRLNMHDVFDVQFNINNNNLKRIKVFLQ